MSIWPLIALRLNYSDAPWFPEPPASSSRCGSRTLSHPYKSPFRDLLKKTSQADHTERDAAGECPLASGQRSNAAAAKANILAP